MEIKYYAFALFIAGLVCLIAILCRVLFADLKRQRKLLDDKETQVLDLYRKVESIIEDFEDQSKASMDEIREYENRAAKRAATAALPPEQPKPEPMPKDKSEFKPPVMDVVESNRMRVAGEVLARAERMVKNSAVVQSAVSSKNDGGDVFQRLFDDTITDMPQPSEELPGQSARNESIIALAESGKSASQIARELGITQNEVSLVIGLTSKR